MPAGGEDPSAAAINSTSAPTVYWPLATPRSTTHLSAFRQARLTLPVSLTLSLGRIREKQPLTGSRIRFSVPAPAKLTRRAVTTYLSGQGQEKPTPAAATM